MVTIVNLTDIIKVKKVISAEEALKIVSNRMVITRLAKDGKIQHLGGGYYADISLNDFVAGLMVVAKYYRKGVVSGVSALRIQELGDDQIYKIDIDIPNTTSIKNSILNVHRIAKKYLIDYEILDYMGAKIKVYDPTRCLYEAYKLSGYGHEFFKAIKRYHRKYKDNINYKKLEKLDRIFGVQILKCLVQEGADEF